MFEIKGFCLRFHYGYVENDRYLFIICEKSLERQNDEKRIST